MSIKIPEQWPQDVVDKYEPVRLLGTGGFASVVLAQRRKPEEGKPKLVAIKVVGSKDVTRQEVGYAHREIDILAELNHPGIMKVIDHWEPPVKDHKCASIMALSYSKGPTLEQILRKGGALSMVFGRVVCAQLTDVLAYLHSHAVLHRDIKPDNVIITGAAYEQDGLWDEVINESEVKDWAMYRKKWHLTLVDFGFARALGPGDIDKSKAATSAKDSKKSLNTSLSKSGDSKKSLNTSLGKSVSRRFTRKMSALGNRTFAAPEVMRGVQTNSKHGKFNLPYDDDKSVHLTDNLAQCLSSYGMLAEAYALGNTIKYAMTGVQPNKNIEEAITSQISPLACLFGCGGPKKTKDGKVIRQVQYRRISEIPHKEVERLISALTQSDVDKRTSVRSARRYLWIDEVLDTDPASEKIEYLSFTINDKDIIHNGKRVAEKDEDAMDDDENPAIVSVEA